MRNLSVLFVLILNVGCVKPPDVWVCRDLTEKVVITEDAFGVEEMNLRGNPVCLSEIKENRCGYCVRSISGTHTYVGEDSTHQLEGKKWSEMRIDSVMLPADSYAALKEFIINSCKKSNQCAEGIAKWRTNLELLKK